MESEDLVSDRTVEQDERRDHAIAAVRDRMTDDLEAIGWAGVFRSIEAGWRVFADGRPVDRLPMNERLAWVSLLGHLPAETVRAALRQWPATEQGAHCPKPAELASMLMAQQRPREQATNQPPRTRPDQEASALLVVMERLRAGESVCECSPAPVSLVIDSAGVLHCPDCAGIEQGQADQAREFADPVPEGDVAFADLGAVVRLRRVRQQRAARAVEERKVGA